MIKLIFLSIIYLPSLINPVLTETVNECSSKAKDIDVTIEDMYLFGSANHRFPTNAKQLKGFCRTNVDSQEKIKVYSQKCLAKLSQRILNLLLYSISKNNANTCKSKKRSADFIKYGQCGNVAQRDNRKCWHTWLYELDGIKTLPEYKYKVPLACCTFYKMRSCFQRTYESNTKQCTKKAQDGLDKLLDVYATETLSLICGDYRDDNDKCDKIMPLIPKATTSDKTNSPINLLISILNGIPDGVY